MPDAPLIRLASASPRRRELLAQIGVPHVVDPAHIDETVRPDERPRDYAARMAREKALSVRERATDLPVLAADTIVVVDGVTYGKPRDRAQALEMLATLSGREHEVVTAIALACDAVAISDGHGEGGHGEDDSGLVERTSYSLVRFRKTTPQERAAYWDTGEPRDKAGAYAVQGLGAVFIAELRGSFSGVMGLPLHETAELLQLAGIPYWRVG